MSRITKECARGHLFEPDYPESDDCPFCAQVYQPRKTQPIYPEEMGKPDSPAGAGRPAGGASPLGRSKTVSVLSDLGEPVVGWFVAIAGPLRGQDFRVPMGRSSFGRGSGCRICIPGDPTVSEQQGYINYSKNRRFMISPGEGSSILYLNGQEVLAPLELKAHDVLEMGSTQISFMPFCGDSFDWSEASP